MHIVAWNVDGYDDKIHAKLMTTNYDIVFLSETKRNKDYLESKLKEFTNYNYIVNVHKPANFHGVAMLIKKGIDYEHVGVKLDIVVRSDNKSGDPGSGRIIVIKTNNLHIVGTYVPNSGGVKDEKKLNYRTSIWDPALYNVLNGFDKVIWLGDINVAMSDLDVSHPERMCYFAGYTKQECDNINKLLLNKDWVDVWRDRNPDKKQYTWVGYPNKKNYGLRLDNIIVKNIASQITDVYIDDTFNLSDHLLVGCKIDLII